MPRYLGQRDSFRCGPIAIINIMKWAGYYCTEKKDLKRIAKQLKTTRCNGTSDTPIDKLLKQLNGIKATKGRAVTRTSRIDKELDKGKIALIRYMNPYQKYGHIFLCVGKQGRYYVCVNDGGTRAISLQLKTHMRNTLRRDRTVVWFVEKLHKDRSCQLT
jgi:hypothetical protein